jgi:hypothetical protein
MLILNRDDQHKMLGKWKQTSEWKKKIMEDHTKHKERKEDQKIYMYAINVQIFCVDYNS